MPFAANILRDLCVACADAVDISQRGAAHRLLCHELADRLRASASDVDLLGTHPAFADDAVADFITSGGVQTETRIGGIVPAIFYFAQPEVWDIAAPHAPQGDYPTLLQELQTQAAALSAAFRSATGDVYVDAARSLIRASAAASAAFASVPMFATSTTDSAIVLTGGIWRVQFSGRMRSESTTPGVSVGFTLDLDGTTVATQLVARATSGIGDDIDILTAFDTSDDISVSGTKTLTLVNPTGSTQWADGLLRYWPAL